ncbi:MAG TPA: hypothetical protein VFR86_19015, partial [Burkholderiaceae bacterium]|nr:hypothetical protein [Burkholderiaceae bacterium]
AADPAALHRIATQHRGLPAGGKLAWSFDGPQRAIRCAHAMFAASGGSARIGAGIHAGEVRRESGALLGEGLDTALTIARSAGPGEVRVSRVVRDLVHGAALGFTARDDVRLADGRAIATFASLPGRDQ